MSPEGIERLQHGLPELDGRCEQLRIENCLALAERSARLAILGILGKGDAHGIT